MLGFTIMNSEMFSIFYNSSKVVKQIFICLVFEKRVLRIFFEMPFNIRIKFMNYNTSNTAEISIISFIFSTL